MRNQVLYSMLGMAALFLVNGCTKQQAEPVLELSQSTVTIGAAGGSGSVSYKVTNPVSGAKPSVKAEENNWVSDIAVSDKAITFNVAENMETASRSVKLTVSYPNAKETEFTIEQAAAEPVPEIVLENAEYNVAAEGGSCSVNYSIKNPVDGETVKAELLEATEWLSNIKVTSSAITFDVAVNNVEEARNASITLSYKGAISVDLKVNQDAAAPVEYKTNPNWTVTYTGKGWDDMTPVDIFNVNVTGGTDGYMFGAVPATQFKDIKSFVESMVAEYQELLDAYGMEWADILNTKSGDAAVNVLDSSVEWYGIAFGVSPEGRPTGLYSMTELVAPEQPEGSEAYNKWLGSWRFEDASQVGFDIVISEEVGNMTYLMSGWEPGIFQDGETPAVRVNFDEETGNMVFVPNEYIDNITVNVSLQGGGTDVCALCFYGIDNTEGYFWPGNLIGNAVMNEGNNSAAVTGITFEDKEAGTFTMGSMCMILVSLQSQGAYSASDPKTIPSFPATMTKKSSSSLSSVRGTENTVRMQIIDSPVVFGPQRHAVSVAPAKSAR